MLDGDYMLHTSVNSFFCAVRSSQRRFVTINKKRYLRVCMGFDIETTKKNKHGFMWCWQMSLGPHGEDVIVGRTWTQYHELFDRLNNWLMPMDLRIIIWVANLGHEHSFIGQRHNWSEIFAIDAHEPLICRCGNIEYREALSISGPGGLAELAKNYTTKRKKTGDLDYNVQRNSMTPIKDEEWGYIITDVEILAEWAEYLFSTYCDNNKRLPLTATGIPRYAVRDAAEATGQIKEIRRVVRSVYPTRERYNFIMRYLFRGGYTHANIYNAVIVHNNCIGADFDSSYPASMEHGYYPVSKFVRTTLECDGKEVTDEKLDRLCVWMILEFTGIEKKTMHTIESEHKILRYDNARFDNGRLTSADFIQVALTELDYRVYQMFYKWDHVTVLRSYSAPRGRLPRYVLNTLEHFYRLKWELKQAGRSKEPVYQYAKAGLNSIYGLMVQRLNMTEWKYIDGKWKPEETKKTYRQMISRQILSCWWGIWITSHSRFNICKIIHALDPDMDTNNVLYCDTDSVYFLDTPRNRSIIEEYNKQQLEKNKKLPVYMSRLGCFDWVDNNEDGSPCVYHFKTLGAKRYIKVYQKDGEDHLEVTIAGIRKDSIQRKLMETFKPADGVKWTDPKTKRTGYISESKLFETFTDYMLLTMAESDKTTCLYDSEPYSEVITDEYGNTETMSEMCGCAIVDIPYKLTMDPDFLSYILFYLEKAKRERVMK